MSVKPAEVEPEDLFYALDRPNSGTTLPENYSLNDLVGYRVVAQEKIMSSFLDRAKRMCTDSAYRFVEEVVAEVALGKPPLLVQEEDGDALFHGENGDLYSKLHRMVALEAVIKGKGNVQDAEQEIRAHNRIMHYMPRVFSIEDLQDYHDALKEEFVTLVSERLEQKCTPSAYAQFRTALEI